MLTFLENSSSKVRLSNNFVLQFINILDINNFLSLFRYSRAYCRNAMINFDFLSNVPNLLFSFCNEDMVLYFGDSWLLEICLIIIIQYTWDSWKVTNSICWCILVLANLDYILAGILNLIHLFRYYDHCKILPLLQIILHSSWQCLSLNHFKLLLMSL